MARRKNKGKAVTFAGGYTAAAIVPCATPGPRRNASHETFKKVCELCEKEAVLAVKAKLSNVAGSRAKGTNTFAVAVVFVVQIMAEFCGAYTLVENNNMRDFAGLALASKTPKNGPLLPSFNIKVFRRAG